MTEQAKIGYGNDTLLERYVYPQLSGINIVKGCGTRVCRICSETSPIYQGSMPFEVLSTLFSGYTGDNQLMLFGQGDPIYYNDKGYSLRDVFALAKDNNVRVNARTHGCLRRESDTLRAVSDLVDYLLSIGFDRNQLKFDFSVDEYGWFGVSTEEHLASIAQFYQLIAPLNPNVFAFHNDNAAYGEFGSQRSMYHFLERAGIPIRNSYPQDIEYFVEGDRPSRLIPKPSKNYYNRSWIGTFIEADGTILHTHPSLGVISCGSIYGNIFVRSLPQPE